MNLFWSLPLPVARSHVPWEAGGGHLQGRGSNHEMDERLEGATLTGCLAVLGAADSEAADSDGGDLANVLLPVVGNGWIALERPGQGLQSPRLLHHCCHVRQGCERGKHVEHGLHHYWRGAVPVKGVHHHRHPAIVAQSLHRLGAGHQAGQHAACRFDYLPAAVGAGAQEGQQPADAPSLRDGQLVVDRLVGHVPKRHNSLSGGGVTWARPQHRNKGLHAARLPQSLPVDEVSGEVAHRPGDFFRKAGAQVRASSQRLHQCLQPASLADSVLVDRAEHCQVGNGPAAPLCSGPLWGVRQECHQPSHTPSFTNFLPSAPRGLSDIAKDPCRCCSGSLAVRPAQVQQRHQSLHPSLHPESLLRARTILQQVPQSACRHLHRLAGLASQLQHLQQHGQASSFVDGRMALRLVSGQDHQRLHGGERCVVAIGPPGHLYQQPDGPGAVKPLPRDLPSLCHVP
mmetsp:Transcript_34815/g.98707  ORF Transcript_34815/g.98707 Transcript_34815/m.98707 type:complete len:457 (-) Transcript_34815:864-2234(-)